MAPETDDLVQNNQAAREPTLMPLVSQTASLCGRTNVIIVCCGTCDIFLLNSKPSLFRVNVAQNHTAS